MAGDVQIKIDSAMFQKFLKDAPQKVAGAMRNIIYKTTLLIERGAKLQAPVDTGRLRASISSEIHAMTAEVHTNVSYARFVHDGTRYMAGRPFMANAAKDVESQIPGLIKDELKVLE
jgi:HK97 gp10 family phage protein